MEKLPVYFTLRNAMMSSQLRSPVTCKSIATILGITYPGLKAWIYRERVKSIKSTIAGGCEGRRIDRAQNGSEFIAAHCVNRSRS